MLICSSIFAFICYLYITLHASLQVHVFKSMSEMLVQGWMEYDAAQGCRMAVFIRISLIML